MGDHTVLTLKTPRWRRQLVAAAAGLGVASGWLVGCGGQSTLIPDVPEHGEGAAAQTPLELREIFGDDKSAAPAGIRADLKQRLVEFDAMVSPMLVRDARSPLVFLEVMCCSPNTREHETLVVTGVTPSLVHAALLASGFQSGSPGGFRRSDSAGDGAGLERVRPLGDGLEVAMEWTDASTGAHKRSSPTDWIVNSRDGEQFSAWLLRRFSNAGEIAKPGETSAFVFAGSRMIRPASLQQSVAGGEPPRERYAADLGGNIIGLSTFGDEVIALREVLSPEAGIETPEWVVDFSKVPPAGTLVRVQIRAAR